MRLVEVQVHNFKNILDSTPVNVDPTITSVVGKNESGKTAFLHALYRSNPAHTSAKFSVQQQYPAWLEKQHRREGNDLEHSRPVRATFELEAKDLSLLESRFGQGILTSKQVILEREYSGKGWLTYQTDERSAVRHILREVNVPADFAESVAKASTFAHVEQLVQNLTKEAGEHAKAASGAITTATTNLLGKASDLR